MKFIVNFFLWFLLNSSFSQDYNIGFLSSSDSFVNAKVLKVIDGDTVIVMLENSTSNYLRLLYIDAMEMYENDRLIRQLISLRKRGNYVRKDRIIQWGNMAKNKVMEILKEESIIQIEIPVTQKVDIYNRWLGIVFINGTNLNYYMVRNGYARTYFYNSEKTERANFYQIEFKKAEKKAKEDGLGIWQN